MTFTATFLKMFSDYLHLQKDEEMLSLARSMWKWKKQNKRVQNRQPLLKAKHCYACATFRECRPTLRYRNTTAASATKRMCLLHGSSSPGALPTHKTHVTLTFDLKIQ